MKRTIYIFFIVLISLFACNTVKQPYVTEYDNIMFNTYESYYNQSQLDSICTVDGLEYDLDEWIQVYLRDDETKEVIFQYLYIKKLGENEIIYRVEKINGNLYKITKRVTE